jgi:hypothetical protein
MPPLKLSDQQMREVMQASRAIPNRCAPRLNRIAASLKGRDIDDRTLADGITCAARALAPRRATLPTMFVTRRRTRA